MRSVLADHSIPIVPPSSDAGVGGAGVGAGEGGGVEGGAGESRTRPVETLAACVHTDNYGTRSSTIVTVPAEPEQRPRVLVADGHPCTAWWTEVTALFET
jgi:hypothetical protein